MKRIVISGLLVIFICLCTGCIQSQSDNSSVITQNLQNTQAISNWNASDVEKSISEKNYANLKFTNDFTVIAPESVQTLSRMTCTSKENISQKGLQEVFDKALIDIFSGRFTQTELDDFRKNVQVQENMLFLENEKMGLTVMQPGYIHAYNRGIALELDDNPSPANIYFPSESHPVLEVYNTDQLDSKETLIKSSH